MSIADVVLILFSMKYYKLGTLFIYLFILTTK